MQSALVHPELFQCHWSLTVSAVSCGWADNVPTHLSASDILTFSNLYYAITHGLSQGSLAYNFIRQTSCPKSMISDTPIIYPVLKHVLLLFTNIFWMSVIYKTQRTVLCQKPILKIFTLRRIFADCGPFYAWSLSLYKYCIFKVSAKYLKCALHMPWKVLHTYCQNDVGSACWSCTEAEYCYSKFIITKLCRVQHRSYRHMLTEAPVSLDDTTVEPNASSAKRWESTVVMTWAGDENDVYKWRSNDKVTARPTMLNQHNFFPEWSRYT